ncbi:hypothetical protein QW131_30990 [Roseibium salinum]|nr:hypothetical protein [Roseibium salinum]
MFTTSPEKNAAPPAGFFAKESGGPVIAITGTSMSDLKEPNFAGFIGQATGLDYANYSIAGGNQYGAISAYLLSEEFHENPPAFLVWENPIYNNLGEFGGQPLEELIASAWDDCRPLPTSRDGDVRFTASLSGNVPGARDFIRVTTGGARARSVEITFVDEAGLSHGTSINRPVRADPTERFYQSVRPFWQEDLSEIRIRFDRSVADAAAVAVCSTEETEG